MDARHEHGLQLAQRGHITKHANGWKVLSQSGNGSDFVHIEGNPSCTCPDFEIRQQPCKHIHAVECLMAWETITDGGQTITTKTKTVRVTYKQNWPAYNAAQTEEKARFIVLLDALCKLVEQPRASDGEPPLALCRYDPCLCLQDLCGFFLTPLYE